jgi:hypothetical protein
MRLALASTVVAWALPAWALAASPASETRCWVDHGVMVAPAAFGDIAGDFLIDLAAPSSVLHYDVAAGDGITATSADAQLTLAGRRMPAHLAVASLDARSLGLPTSIDGLIGADVLAGDVVDLRLSPCRVRLWRGRAPSVRATEVLPIVFMGGVPTVKATITDGHSVLSGAFAIDTGSAGVRVSTAAARLSRTPTGLDTGSRLAPPARLAAVEVGELLRQRVPAATADDLPPGVLGALGTAVWAGYDLRIDLRRKRLELIRRP